MSKARNYEALLRCAFADQYQIRHVWRLEPVDRLCQTRAAILSSICSSAKHSITSSSEIRLSDYCSQFRPGVVTGRSGVEFAVHTQVFPGVYCWYRRVAALAASRQF